MYVGVDVRTHVFLTSALLGGEWWASRPGRFTPGERGPSTHWIGGWVGPRVGLDNMEKWKFLPPLGLEPRPFGRPACSQSLYWLHYHIPPLKLLVRGMRFFPLCITSRLALRSTQAPIQWVPGAVSQGVKQQGHEADHSPQFIAEIKNGEATPPLCHVYLWHIA
jgi:hypothetical protein